MHTDGKGGFVRPRLTQWVNWPKVVSIRVHLCASVVNQFSTAEFKVKREAHLSLLQTVLESH